MTPRSAPGARASGQVRRFLNELTGRYAFLEPRPDPGAVCAIGGARYGWLDGAQRLPFDTVTVAFRYSENVGCARSSSVRNHTADRLSIYASPAGSPPQHAIPVAAQP